mmetsp:Transcript_1860/g.5447  ORF Transcript_1860/g.5447 Transcript_1860/m.5447 type:complete len:359 (+) Transcript_1860:570-1646(+)
MGMAQAATGADHCVHRTSHGDPTRRSPHVTGGQCDGGPVRGHVGAGSPGTMLSHLRPWVPVQCTLRSHSQRGGGGAAGKRRRPGLSGPHCSIGSGPCLGPGSAWSIAVEGGGHNPHDGVCGGAVGPRGAVPPHPRPGRPRRAAHHGRPGGTAGPEGQPHTIPGRRVCGGRQSGGGLGADHAVRHGHSRSCLGHRGVSGRGISGAAVDAANIQRGEGPAAAAFVGRLQAAGLHPGCHGSGVHVQKLHLRATIAVRGGAGAGDPGGAPADVQPVVPLFLPHQPPGAVRSHLPPSFPQSRRADRDREVDPGAGGHGGCPGRLLRGGGASGGARNADPRPRASPHHPHRASPVVLGDAALRY